MPQRTDINTAVAGWLHDLAAAQTLRQKEFGYKRAAHAVLTLERPLTDLIKGDGSLPAIHGIGPASTKVILEVLATGVSSTVERAVDESGRRLDIERRRDLRSNFLSRAEVLRVLSDSALDGPERDDLQGDFQMHSEWSDGSSTLEEMAAGCVSRGYRYAAITDHAFSLKIANGMSMADARRQHAAIDAINARSASAFRVLKGIEANITVDGSLDLSPDEIHEFDLVLAAPHSKLRIVEDQTSRLLRAITTPGVHVLAHPRGRVGGSRAGIVADWDLIFAKAKTAHVAIEIDGDPSRQDLDYALAGRAHKAGCLLALDSDAHNPSQLGYADIALAHARLAGIPPSKIVNCWELDRVLEWLGDRA